MATPTVLLLIGLPPLRSLVEKGAKEREREELEVWIMNKSNLIYIYLYIVLVRKCSVRRVQWLLEVQQ